MSMEYLLAELKGLPVETGLVFEFDLVPDPEAEGGFAAVNFRDKRKDLDPELVRRIEKLSAAAYGHEETISGEVTSIVSSVASVRLITEAGEELGAQIGVERLHDLGEVEPGLTFAFFTAAKSPDDIAKSLEGAVLFTEDDMEEVLQFGGLEA